jgi:hypothetical protein
MIRDTEGNEITYWPLTLKAGEYSEILTIQLDVPRQSVLRATRSDVVQIFGRRAGTLDVFVNLSEVGLPLGGYAGPNQLFEIYAYANEDVEGLPRIPLTIGSMSSGPAGWLD